MRFWRLVVVCLVMCLMCPGLLWAAEEDGAANQRDDQIHWVGFPVIYSSPETDLALGGLFMAYRNTNPDQPQGKKDVLQGVLIYTQKEQAIFNLGLNKYFQAERYLLMLNGGYVNFPNKFYGIGPDTDEDLEEDYTSISKGFRGSFLWRLAPDFYVGPAVVYNRFEIEDVTPGGLLEAGNITGYDGTTVGGAGLKLIRDTRDDAFLPQNGSLFDAEVIGYRHDWGSSRDFSQLTISYRQFWPFRKTGTLALMNMLILSDGTVPFEMMPVVGMRGYFAGRYRDCNYFGAQGEYRFPIAGRFSGVVFTSAEEVVPELDRFAADYLKWAGGFGFRFRLDPSQKLNIRADIGYSETGLFTYINFMEAF